MSRISLLSATLAVELLVAGCSAGTKKASDAYSDASLVASKPPGTNAIIVRALGFGGGTIAMAGASPTCVSFDFEDSHYSQVCWAFVVPAASPTVTVTATPASGSRFTSWSGGPCAGSTEPSCLVPTDRDRVMMVGFTSDGAVVPRSDRTLRVNVVGLVDGEVTATASPTPPGGFELACQAYDPEDLVNVRRSCSATVPPGTQVTLEATPTQPGTWFSGWGGNCAGTGTCTVSVDRDLGVTALFARSVTAGQPPTVEAFLASPSTVSPGQSTILFWSVQGATSISIDGGVGAVSGVVAEVRPSSTTTYTLTSVNANGTTRRSVTVQVMPAAVVTRLTTDPGNDFGPVWQTDRGIAFHSNRRSDRPNGADVWQVQSDGTNQRELVHVTVTSPAWWGDSGLGRGLVVLDSGDLIVKETQYFFEFMKVSTSTAGALPIVRTVWDGNDASFQRLMLITGGQDANYFALSRATGMAAWVANVYGVQQLRTASYASLAGQASDRYGSVLLSVPSGGQIAGISYSPDGSRLAAAVCASSCGTGRGADIVVLNALTGAVLETVTTTGAAGTANTDPQWSPDGGWIAFGSATGSSRRVWVAATAGARERRELQLGVEASQPAWSPDGSSLAFVGTSSDGNQDIWIVTNPLGDACSAPAASPPIAVANPTCEQSWNHAAYRQEQRRKLDQAIYWHDRRARNVMAVYDVADTAVQLYDMAGLSGDFWRALQGKYTFNLDAFAAISRVLLSEMFPDEVAARISDYTFCMVQQGLDCLSATGCVLPNACVVEEVAQGLLAGFLGKDFCLATRDRNDLMVAREILDSYYLDGGDTWRVATSYGLPRDASVPVIIEAVAQQWGLRDWSLDLCRLTTGWVDPDHVSRVIATSRSTTENQAASAMHAR